MEIDLRRGVCYIISHAISELRFCCFGIKIRLYFSSAHNWTWQRDDTDAPNVGDSPPGPATATPVAGEEMGPEEDFAALITQPLQEAATMVSAN
ncbi:hypothetical protein LEMLEM_LOCUS7592 [Lemmus lemmus]